MKYHGKIGFSTFKEKTLGVDVECVEEHEYFGDVIRNSKRFETGQQVNPNLQINNQISIVADPYARENLFSIRYASWMGCLWEITSVDVQYPRMILSIGGAYNGPTPGSSNGVGDSDGYWSNGEVPTSVEY